MRPHLEAIVVEPDVRMAEVLRLKPGLVISGLPKFSGGCEIAWVEFRPCDESPDRVCAGERCTLVYEPGLDDLLSAVDEAELLSRRPPEGPIAFCQAPHVNEGEHRWAGF